ncbi:UNC93-like protein MFSD11 [Diabrotica undecimpunctata]|uniref:UNC93-like protein MFSD11 n=1 Tax=Diabrotica undecimpunctata TaxID=50387 RepID=UPI003B638BA3
MSNIQRIFIDSIKKEKPSYKENGYYSQAVNSAFYAASTWAVPSIINVFGVKVSMCLGALVNVLFILQFLLEEVWILYLFCGLAGVGSALLGATQGEYLVLNSSEKTMNRNSAICTIISSFNMIIGNIIVMCGFSGKTEINKSTRILVLTIFAGVCTAGLFVFVLLPVNKKEEKSKETLSKVGAIESFIKAVKLFITRNMLILSVSFLYGGVNAGFLSGIYSSAIGFTQKLPNSKQLVGLSGIFTGIGEIFAGIIITIFDEKIVSLGRKVLIVTGCSLHGLSFILIFINLPDNSTNADTNDAAIIESNTFLAMFCSFLLGLGDCINGNVLFSLLGTLYSESAAEAFSILQFFVGIGLVINFMTAGVVGLYYQLAALFLLAILNVGSVIKVDTYCNQNVLIKNKTKTEISH